MCCAALESWGMHQPAPLHQLHRDVRLGCFYHTTQQTKDQRVCSHACQQLADPVTLGVSILCVTCTSLLHPVRAAAAHVTGQCGCGSPAAVAPTKLSKHCPCT
jgi:hypothetical protein